MTKTEILAMSLFLTGCPVAMANQLPTEEMCVIDRCDKQVCTIETPEGTVEIDKKRDYKEGKQIVCPIWLIEPT
jgi:hypothetical protein